MEIRRDEIILPIVELIIVSPGPLPYSRRPVARDRAINVLAMFDEEGKATMVEPYGDPNSEIKDFTLESVTYRKFSPHKDRATGMHHAITLPFEDYVKYGRQREIKLNLKYETIENAVEATTE